jgi:hypothetical protein
MVGTRRPCLLIGLVILAGIRWVVVGPAPRGFTPYAPRALPQRAQADFDGDGRVDVALIRDGANGSQVSITLSDTSSHVEYLNANVGSLVAEDIDGDGDLDLVAASPSGQVMAWINDGQGRFTLKEARPSSPRLSPETVFADALRGEPVAFYVAAPLAPPGTRSRMAVVVTRGRPPTVFLEPGLGVLSLSSPRAPPVSLSFS